MSADLSSIARSKLQLSVTNKDKDRLSLHRWVLLKNSIIHSNPVPPNTPTSEHAEMHPPTVPDESDFEQCAPDETDSFMFPDVGKFDPAEEVDTSEAQWLDSLLETLGDDEDYDYGSEVDVVTIPVDDEDDHLLSPLASPMSSSDDLVNQTYYTPQPVEPYRVPFSFPQQLLLSYPFDSPYVASSITSIPPPYDDPLPYFDQDDVEDLPVPDAIEDTSDDESETPPTPSLGNSASSISLGDAASIPLPVERSRLRHSQPRIYVDSEDSYFYPFELDPLPFPRNYHHTSYNTYQEC